MSRTFVLRKKVRRDKCETDRASKGKILQTQEPLAPTNIPGSVFQSHCSSWVLRVDAQVKDTPELL